MDRASVAAVAGKASKGLGGHGVAQGERGTGVPGAQRP